MLKKLINKYLNDSFLAVRVRLLEKELQETEKERDGANSWLYDIVSAPPLIDQVRQLETEVRALKRYLNVEGKHISKDYKIVKKK